MDCQLRDRVGYADLGRSARPIEHVAVVAPPAILAALATNHGGPWGHGRNEVEQNAVKSTFPRCRGTVEDHKKVALDVRELTRERVFERPDGSMFHLAMRYPWLRTMRLDGFSLVLHLATGRVITIPWTCMRCGFVDARILRCPSCRRRTYSLYHLGNQVVCRTCTRLWYASQRRSANGRRVLAAQRLRFKLGASPQSLSKPDAFLPRPRGMHRKTYERLQRRDEFVITWRLNRCYWRDPDWSVLVARGGA
jgi:hypothetical protein